jgi:hypothetical protein
VLEQHLREVVVDVFDVFVVQLNQRQAIYMVKPNFNPLALKVFFIQL